MLLIRLTVTLVLVASLEASILRYLPFGKSRDHKDQLQTTWSPAFCNGLNCPKYTVIEQHKEYELREYDMSQWVSVNQKGIKWREAQYSLFMKLFQYISGHNEQKQKVAMTAPVIDRIIPGQGPACENDFTMSFFVAPSADKPPTPIDPVKLTELPKQRVYVRAFPGYAMFDLDTWAAQAQKLVDAIGDTSKYHTEYYYTAGYDSPARLFNRHNEIWYIAK